MDRRGDAIAVVEASYDLQSQETDWFLGVARAVNAMPLCSGLGTLAYHVTEHPGGHFEISNAVQSSSQLNLVGRIERMGRLLRQRREGDLGVIGLSSAAMYERVLRLATRSRPNQLVLLDFDLVGPRWMYTLGVPNVRDVMMLVNHHIDGLGITIVARGLAAIGRLRPAERRMYQMLGAHIKAGFRLRRRLRKMLDLSIMDEGDAVIDAKSARVLHARGEARNRSPRQTLREHALRIEHVRTAAARRDSCRALEVWEGLIDGRWSLVDQVDRDGRRYIVAHRNAESVADPRGLTDMEVRTVRLASLGYCNKVIAYHLGLSEGTVSTHLHYAMRKLGIGTRVELLRILGASGGATYTG